MLGAWNIHTLMDKDNVPRPERRTALIARELAHYNIDIAALSETRLAGEGSTEERGDGYTFFWKGKAESEGRIHGVGLTIKTSLLKRLPDLPIGLNECLMTLRFPLNPVHHITIISAYALTLISSEEEKEHFYSDLDAIIRSTPADDKLVLFGNFNARVCKDNRSWSGAMGKHGVGKMNSNGQLLLSKCAEYNLLINNTMFRQADKYKTSWMHLRSKQWHMIDYVITH
nr:PREDICTED: craniofacial development protein 2-like [Latimeria chalumnae]|eukprot:XP_014348724.1 PREDICTED: craniofacial development protein 2-like [Latimeria chalumnae]